MSTRSASILHSFQNPKNPGITPSRSYQNALNLELIMACSAKRGSVSQYSKLINEESHKTKDSASADTAQWEGPAIDLSIGIYSFYNLSGML